MNSLEAFWRKVPEIEQKLCYHFHDPQLLLLAFVHRSFVNEHRDLAAEHNERLEFLGDSVLGLLIAEYLYRTHPQTPEGELSHLRSNLVQAEACVRYLEQLGVAGALLLGKGERMSEGRGRESIYADLFEAIVGAIFLDGGLQAAGQFLFGQLGTTINALIERPGRNWKAELQDYAQRQFQQTPSYRLVSETGPDHSKQFVISVAINDEVLGTGEGGSKKEAQQRAAEEALAHITAKGHITDGS